MSRASQTNLSTLICMCQSKDKHMVVLIATVINVLLDVSDLVSVNTEVFLSLMLENNWDKWLHKFYSKHAGYVW